MSRVLLLDTSFAARPVHDWLLQQGFEIWTIGNRPDDILALRDPERYLQISYADVDQVQAHVNRLGIDYVVPGCTDVSIETALRLKGVKTELDSPEAHHQLADKAAFRALCSNLNLPAPRVVDVDHSQFQGTLIAKPVDSFSGRGISVFDSADASKAADALDLARKESRTGEAILETFIDGQLLSYSAFLEDRAVTDAIIVREDGSVTPYAVDVSHVVWDFPADGVAVLKDSVEKIAKALNLVDGLLHVQFIWDGQCPWIIETCRRCPGDLYPSLIELSTGQPYAGRYASYFVGRKIAFSAAEELRCHILRHTVTAGHSNYEGIWLEHSLTISEFHPLREAGRVPPSPDRIDRVALMFAEFEGPEELEVARARFIDRTIYHTATTLPTKSGLKIA